MAQLLELDRVTFGYDTAAEPLFTSLTARFPTGWTGIVGPNGSGKTTLLDLVAGRLTPNAGSITGPRDVVSCEQRTDVPPAELDELAASADGDARRLCGRLGIDETWSSRWPTLSHGERKRAQLGVALWGRPEVLVLDEPTNHVDASTRDTLISLLRDFRGIGLVVSHDRALLDTLCRQCLFLGHAAGMRPGGYTAAAAAAAIEAAAARRENEQARTEQKRLRRAAATRRDEASRADGRRSKRGLARKDHDAKARIDAARVSGKDGQAGRLADQLAGRLRQADERARDARVARRRTLGVTMRGAPARRDALWRTDGVTVSLGGRRRLEIPETLLGVTDRVGLAGPNGAGKSTLVRLLMEQARVEPERLVYLPQEMDREAAQSVHAALRALPASRRGEVLAAIDCLGSEPQRILETESLSPGEARKVMLALGLAREPNLVVMDEPTNHLDLPSVECLEHALTDCAAALLLASHDDRFLDAVTTTRWMIEVSASDPDCRKMKLTRPNPDP